MNNATSIYLSLKIGQIQHIKPYRNSMARVKEPRKWAGFILMGREIKSESYIFILLYHGC